MMKALNETQQQYAKFYIGIFAACIFAVYLNLQNQPLNITHVSPLQAKTLIDNGAVVFDVRSLDAYESRHIPGAISLPLSMLEEGIPDTYENIKTKDIVVYCGDGVTKGPVATDILNKAGYTKAVNIKPGIQGWADAGYAVDKKI